MLIVTKNEEWSFWLLKILIENITQCYHTRTMDGLITDIAILRELLDERVPEISQHVDEIGMPFAIITTKWFICMFAEVLPVETVFRVWDCLFMEGRKVSIPVKQFPTFEQFIQYFLLFLRFYFASVLHFLFKIKTIYWLVMTFLH